VAHFLATSNVSGHPRKGGAPMKKVVMLALLAASRLLAGENKILNSVVDTLLLFIFFAVAEMKDKYFTLLFKRGK
jgi:hypothetical protein